MGHTGYVGRNLLRWFREKDVPTAGLSRASLSPEEAEGCSRQFGIQDLEGAALPRFLRDAVNSIVILSADTRKSISSAAAPSMIAANVGLPAQVSIMAAEAGVSRVVFASTYSIQVGKEAFSPQSLYAASKKAAEDILEYVAMTSLTAVTALRLYDIYGPHQPHDRLIPYLVQQTRNNATISMTQGLQEVSPIFVDDVCDVLSFSLSDAEGDSGFRVRSAYGPECVQVRDLPLLLAEAVGSPAPRVVHDKPSRAREALYFQPSHPLPRGWAPSVRIKAGLRSVWEATSK